MRNRINYIWIQKKGEELKFISYLTIVSFIFNLINCTGTIKFNYYFPENSKDVTNLTINTKIKIAFFEDDQNINNSNKEEVNYLKLGFINQNLPLHIVKNRNRFNDFDLIIMNYSVSYPSSFEKGMINTLVFLSYLQMLITLGILYSVDFNYKYHQIEIYNPKTQKESTISFSEHIQKEDGWSPFLYGKFNGEYNEKYKRYLIFNNYSKPFNNLIVKKIILEAN